MRWISCTLDAHHAVLQDAVKDVFNYSDTIHISASDFIADGFRSMESDDLYEALAEKWFTAFIMAA